MKSFQELRKLSKKRPEGAREIKIALLGDSATQLLVTALKGTGADRGFCFDILEADYSQIERQILDPTSEYHSFKPDYTVIFQSTHKLLEQYSRESPQERTSMCSRRLELVKSLAANSEGRMIYLNYPEIDDAVFGSYSSKVESSFIYQLRLLNVELMKLSLALPNFTVCDLASVQAKIGRDRMYDANIYVSTEMLLSLESLPLVAARIVDIIAAQSGKFKKCLICDLDNTLWGGIVGDDGWENLQLGHGLGIGTAFTELQEWIKKLKDRGIIIAICSKNDEDKAKEAFIRNPEMVLKLDDIAVFIANWDNKADNIRRIQKILNIGMDSMVFLDDNPFERNIVRENIPEITVPELPEDPADYLEFLYSENLFETASYSETDSDRTRQYQIEAQRETSKINFTNEDDFLASLDMVSTVEGFTPFNTPRVAQLSQRSNQFNLRTVRYTEDEIRAIENDSRQYATFAFSLRDKFGDNGLISVVILEKTNADTLFVDTWFMSCRVLKRGMENFTLNTIVDYARANGFRKIIGEYLPTPKNGMVRNHYEQLGFSPLQEPGRFLLEVDNYENKNCHIRKENGKN